MSDTAGAIYRIRLKLRSIAPTYLFSRLPHFVSRYNRCTLCTASSLTHFQSTFVVEYTWDILYNIRCYHPSTYFFPHLHWNEQKVVFVFFSEVVEMDLSRFGKLVVNRPRIPNQIVFKYFCNFLRFSLNFVYIFSKIPSNVLKIFLKSYLYFP